MLRCLFLKTKLSCEFDIVTNQEEAACLILYIFPTLRYSVFTPFDLSHIHDRVWRCDVFRTVLTLLSPIAWFVYLVKRRSECVSVL